MLFTIPPQINDQSQTQVQYTASANPAQIVSNGKNFVVPIQIQGQDFQSSQTYQIKLNAANSDMSIDHVQFNSPSTLNAQLIIPTSYVGKQINLSFSLINNNQQLNKAPIVLDFFLPSQDNPQSLSTSAIVGITVTVVVLVGLVGYVIYLVKKRSKNQSLERYHNKRKKYPK